MPDQFSQLRSLVSFTITAGDTAQPITMNDIPAFEVNIHAYTHPAYYGDGNIMGAEIAAGDVVYFRNVNLRDIFIQNKNAGSNAVLYVVAAVPTHEMKTKLKI